MLLKFLFVFIGGGVGSLLRYLVSIFAKKFFLYPLFGTLMVNIAGCFIIGFIFSLILNKTDALSETIRIFAVIGILGGLTTFSTLNIEVFDLIKSGKILYGLLYMLCSCLFGLIFTFLGYFISTNFQRIH